MSIFTTRQPRRFRGVHIYTDPHREKLDKLVADARREEQIARGESVPYTPDIDSYKGKFAQNLKHASKNPNSPHRRLHPIVGVALVVILLFIWRFLQTGSFSF